MTNIDKALSLIREWDADRGEGWSNDSYAIAEIMMEFLNLHNEEAMEIINKGTGNRRYWKKWEKKLIAHFSNKTQCKYCNNFCDEDFCSIQCRKWYEDAS